MLVRVLLAAAVAIATASTALGREGGAGAGHAATRPDARRLLQRFAEDAALVPGGWVEAQYVYGNLPDGSRHFAGPLIAFRLATNVEAGLRFGFLDVESDGGPDGAGLSDIDLYAKYRFPGIGPHRLALGGLVKAATGDEDQGLGTGETDVEVFIAYRGTLPGVILVANAGVRFNGDPEPPLRSTDDSLLLGGAVLLPATRRLTFIVEATYETERIEGTDDDGRLTVGAQVLGRKLRGGFRVGVGAPLTDGAPDAEIIAGAFITY
ncbi:MAG: hypothetical protein ACE5JH_05405 [Acidobacteriota bacterium]